jgi:serine/threonine protein kinase
MVTCPPTDRWHAYLANQVSADEDAALTAHAEVCATCTQTLLNLTHAEPPRVTAVPRQEHEPPPGLIERLRWLWKVGVQEEPEPAGEAAEELWPRIAGYEVHGVLGRGGMGVVYKARQTTLNRTVALKTLRRRGAIALRPDDQQRFLFEAEAVAGVEDPGVVRIFEVGCDAAGAPYMALEFCPGGSLADRLASGPLEPRDAAAMVQALARGLHKVHARGIVHRDITPTNVMAGDDGRWKLTDFGLAKLVETPERLTQSGVVRGTPLYMAPERFTAEGAGLDVRSDIYSLGAVLYEALTGVPPFQGASVADVVYQAVYIEPTPVGQRRREVPRDLETICLKCLEKDPQRRYVTAQELGEDLRRVLAHEPIRARPVGVLERGWRWCRREPRLAGAVAAAVLALLATAAIAAYAFSSARLNDQLAESNRKLESANTDLGSERDRANRNAESLKETAKKTRDTLMSFFSEDQVRIINPNLEQLAIVSVNAYQLAVELDPQDRDVRGKLADAYYALGVVYRDKYQFDKMKAAWRESLKVYDALANDSKGTPAALDITASAGRTCFNLGVAAANERHDYAEAIDWQSEAITRMDSLLKLRLLPNAPFTRQVRWFACWARVGRGEARMRLSQPREALPDWEEALKLADDKNDREAIRLELAYTLARLGEHQKAAAAAKEALASLPDDAVDFRMVAKVFALNAGAAGQGEGDRYAQQAVEYLKAARQRGAFLKASLPVLAATAVGLPASLPGLGPSWTAPALIVERTELVKSDDYKALQGRDDFQAFLRELNAE